MLNGEASLGTELVPRRRLSIGRNVPPIHVLKQVENPGVCEESHMTLALAADLLCKYSGRGQFGFPALIRQPCEQNILS